MAVLSWSLLHFSMTKASFKVNSPYLTKPSSGSSSSWIRVGVLGEFDGVKKLSLRSQFSLA